MVHTVKHPGTVYVVMGPGSPSLLLRAYDLFPPNPTPGYHDQLFGEPSTPRAARVRGRDGWEVSGQDSQMNLTVTYVFDAELGVAIRWQRGDEWMELTDPHLDDAFDRELFTWSGPSRPFEEAVSRAQREYDERQRALALIPQAVPTWLPLTTNVHPQSGDARTGELSLDITGHAPQFTLRRWVTSIGEPALVWPNENTPERYRRTIGDWTYEIRSYNDFSETDCARIIESIVPVAPPDRDPADILAELADEESDRREAEVSESLGTGRVITDHLGGESLLIRTDFTDDARWRDVAVAAMAPVPSGGEGEFAAYLTCIDNRQYDGLTVDGLIDVIGDEPTHYVFLADSVTVNDPEMPIVAVHTGPDNPESPRGRTFRVIPTEMWGVENNLSISNMDFESFADSVDEDGVFRGFPQPPQPVEQVTTRDVAQWIADDLTTDALRDFHAEISGWKYRYPVQLFDVDLSDVNAQFGDSKVSAPGAPSGYEEFVAATAEGGTALRGSVWTHDGHWTFLVHHDSHRPIAAYRVTLAPYAPPPPQEGVQQTPRFEVPFVCTEPRSPILTDEDDLVDRDLVQRAVLAEAARLHPDADITGGMPLMNRIPRLVGIQIGSHVQIDRQPVFYVAIVTDVQDEFLIIEVPQEGLRIVGPGEP